MVSIGPSQRHYTRTHLFLVRIWTTAPEGGNSDESGPDVDEGAGTTAELEWRGTAQRAVDGEAHQFSSWQALVDLLQGMLSSRKGR
jgi:hypothetical protein